MPSNQRGFAAMDPERQREIASKGGRAAHESGHAHEWDSEEASEAAQLSHGERSAFHHETAAHHHTQAGRYRASGEHGRADLHAEAARRHGRSADEWGERASRQNRGFAAMDPERQREIAAMGGRASHGGRGSEYESEGPEDEGQSGRSMRGGTRQQHAEAGRRGAEARWGNDDER
jgi:general stress protein YciG